jgi:hypothetical protein
MELAFTAPQHGCNHQRNLQIQPEVNLREGLFVVGQLQNFYVGVFPRNTPAVYAHRRNQELRYDAPHYAIQRTTTREDP